MSQLSSPSSLGWFSSFAPLAAQKMAVVASMETSFYNTVIGAPVIGKCGKKTTDDRRTGQAWIWDLKKTSIFRHPVS